MRFIDPDGMLENMPNDYFDKTTGKFLGSDNDLENDNVLVIDKKNYDLINTGAKLLNQDPTYALKSASENLKEADLTDAAKASVANHYYEIAGYKLSELSFNPDFNRTMEENSVQITDRWDGVASTNKIGKKLEVAIDYASFNKPLVNRWDFINTFIHERGSHGSDFLNNEKFSNNQNVIDAWETRATNLQVKDNSWGKTSLEYKRHIFKVYGKYVNDQYNFFIKYFPPNK